MELDVAVEGSLRRRAVDRALESADVPHSSLAPTEVLAAGQHLLTTVTGRAPVESANAVVAAYSALPR